MKNMKPDEKTFKAYQVGDIVRTIESFGPNPAGSMGIVYETYPDNEVPASEIVSTVAQLMADYRDGYFSQAFAEARVIANQVGVSSVAEA